MSARAVHSITRTALILALLAGLASASAHSHLSASSPADGSTVTTAPATVELDFTEPVQVRYSVFDALPLPVPFKAGETPSELSKRVQTLASQLSDKALSNKVDAGLRVDTGVSPAKGATDKVALNLESGLKPGYYVVVWRVLSQDGHVTHGAVVFDYQPGP